MPSAAVASPSDGKGGRPSLLGEQVDGERGVAVGGEPRRDRTDVGGETAVLVDHEDRPARIRRGGEHTDQLAAWPGEADLLGDRAGSGASRRGRIARRGVGDRSVDADAGSEWRPSPAGVDAEAVPGDAAGRGGSDRRRDSAVVVAAARRQQRGGRRRRQAEQHQPSHGLAAAEQPVGAVECDFRGEVVAKCHAPSV